MSVIISRKSKNSVLFEAPHPGLPLTGSHTSQPKIDEQLAAQNRSFYRISPARWRVQQYTQYALFLFGAINLFASFFILKYLPKGHLKIRFTTKPTEINTVVISSYIFAVSGLIFLSVSLVVFNFYKTLVERHVDPFKFFDYLTTHTTVIIILFLQSGITAVHQNKALLFACILQPLLILTLEHYKFYSKTLDRINVRITPLGENLLPFFLVLVVQGFTLSILSTRNADFFTYIVLDYAILDIVTFAWLVDKLSFIKVEVVTHAVLFSLRLALAYTAIHRPSKAQL